MEYKHPASFRKTFAQQETRQLQKSITEKSFKIILKPTESAKNLNGKLKSKFKLSNDLRSSNNDDAIPEEYVFHKENDNNILNFLQSRVDCLNNNGNLRKSQDSKTIEMVDNRSNNDVHNLVFRSIIEYDQKSDEIINAEGLRSKIRQEPISLRNGYFEVCGNSNVDKTEISRKLNFDGL